MTGTVHIVLAMKPLAGNFAENAKRHGVAGINIDASRISGPKGDGVWGTSNKTVSRDRKFNASPEMGDYRSEAHTGGRWPPNVILAHLAGCKMVGTRKIKGITGGTGNHDGRVYGSRTNQGEPVKDYADADGKETVEAWECEDGCPVKKMGEQSGKAGAGGQASGPTCRKWGTKGIFGDAKGDGKDAPFHADEGTASRFFKQVRET